jgi:hypothetical protein
MNSRAPFIVFAGLAILLGAYFLGREQLLVPAADAKSEAAGKSASEGNKAPTKTLPATSKAAARTASSAPLPAVDAPLKSTFADLQARAASGDAGAATRLSRDLGRCSRLRSTLWKNASAANDLVGKKTDGMTEAQLRTYQILLDSMAQRQREAQKTQDLCAGVDDEMLATLVPSIAQAAQLGDVDARACYLSRGPGLDARTLLDHPEFLQSYRNTVTSMIDAGLAAGDWRVVDLLTTAYEPGAQGLLAGLVGADPVQHYRYLKLYRLGAESFRSVALDRQLAAAAANLNPAQTADADAWAQAAYEKNFKGPSTAVAPQGWAPCAFAED